MMLDFQAVRDNVLTLNELVADLGRDQLAELTNEMIDSILFLIADCEDDDITFEPIDPEAHDPYAETAEEVNMPWSLGHVIVHITASAEESAFLAAELARGVKFHGRSRSEVPWQQAQTLDSCLSRLEESRRMRLASLDMWPDLPHLDNIYQTWERGPVVNAIGRYVLGLMHSDSHFDQLRDIVMQAEQHRLSAR
jgi:hypothetical protein